MEKYRSEYTRISTKLRVSIGPDGNILHHDVISPNHRQIDKTTLNTSLIEFKEFLKDPCLKKLFKSGGDLDVWISRNQKEILGIQVEGC